MESAGSDSIDFPLPEAVAGAVASLFELTLGAGKPLPDEFKSFLKYKPEVVDAVAPSS